MQLIEIEFKFDKKGNLVQVPGFKVVGEIPDEPDFYGPYLDWILLKAREKGLIK